jgi:hypothetical protein
VAHARFDKFGKRLPDTGHGCGCRLCAEANAPRYDRRKTRRGDQLWSPMRRRVMRFVRALVPARPQAA